MILYVIFEYALMFGALLFIGYPFMLGLFALFSPYKKIVKPVFEHSFLIVVQSHNNEEETSKTLYSLAGLVYPWNLYDLMVVADNCTDDTVSVAKKLGAKVRERGSSSDQGSQTDILPWMLEQVEQMDKKYDAIVFVKPNDFISGNFLEVMNQYLAEGSTIIQSANRRISYQTTWKVRYKRACWLLLTFITGLGRKKLGLGSLLLGSGMCFKTEVLQNKPIEICQIKISQTQDKFEYFMLLQSNGLQVDFAPETEVWTPLYISSKKTTIDRFHWAVRQFQVIIKYLKYLATHFRLDKLFQMFDVVIGMFTLSLTLVFIITGMNCILDLVLWKLGYLAAWFWVIWTVLVGMITIYLTIGIAADRDVFPEFSKSSNMKHTSDYRSNSFSERKQN